MEEVVAVNEETGGEIYLLHDVLSDDQEDPGTKAARKLDWETFMSGLSEREKAVVLQMIEGKTFSSIGRKLKLSPGTVKTTRNHLAQKAAEVMDNDILIQVRRPPQWKADITATKEKLACKHERSH
jgi:DNA-binding NarL/FixJ family response regulator